MSQQTTVFRGGAIETLEPGIGRVRALAVRDGVVVAHGEEAESLAGSGSAVTVDVGDFAMPGLIDSHNHHALAGQIDLYELQVSPMAPLDQILEAVAARAASLPEGAWVVGGSWGSVLHDALQAPGALARLDAASGGHPVMLRDDSKHNRWANSEALRRAGIDQDTQDPPGGQILRTDGLPNGVLLEAGGVLVEHVLGREEPMTAERLAASSERAIGMLHSYGVTAFQDAAASAQLLHALHDLDTEGRLHAWVVTSMLVNDFIFGTDPLGEPIIAERGSTASPHHRPDFIKIFLDGVPPSRTGAFLESYLPDECGHLTNGEPTMSQSELTGWLRSAAERGIGAKVHCTGDASVHMLLDAAEQLRGEGFADTRWHVAHGQFVAPDDIPRFGRLGVTAEVSPQIYYPGVIPQAIAAVLPADRAGRMQPNRSLIDSGARVVGGSDWPVSVTPDVWRAVYGLVTRQDPSRSYPGALWPEQGITLDEAVRAYTSESARALGIDDVGGSLALGKSADIVSLSADPWNVDIEDVPSIHAKGTWFAGAQVFEERS
ncbi:amidohydrolase [Kocuria coralli]|uniref:Amidohydrolase n=1 Tax=Kocuria coralli TaxID=1461025 RepID=A0A5J5KYV4_9MICC|nr:amidohydrolase [Kocuria coralli]KAA9394917.1 amidohydrolase [Kocuria coralli]